MDINSSWKNTCKLLLGEEIGDLQEYESYLKEHSDPVFERKSSISNRSIAISSDDYGRCAKFISNSEVETWDRLFLDKNLDINKMKDVDSIIDAVSERICYSGDIVLGNSSNVTFSNICINSSDVLNSREVYDSKYIAYSNSLRYCEHVFGSNNPGETKYMIRGFEVIKSNRCVEVVAAHNISDCYYTGNLDYCTNCMFSFNLRNKNFCIGNTQFTKEEFYKLKNKLVGDIRETLKSKKTLPSIFSLITGSKYKSLPSAIQEAIDKIKVVTTPSSVPAGVEDAFQKITETVLGKKLSGIEQFSNWLTRHNNCLVVSKSAVGSSDVYAPSISFYKKFESNFINFDEAIGIVNKELLDKKDVEELSISNFNEKMPKIVLSPEVIMGTNQNIVKIAAYNNSSNCFFGSYSNQSKFCAYCFWPRQSEYLVGCNEVFSSKFCIKCYHSVNLTRCFEVGDSTNCSDCYFCSNCENVRESMFCFNTKSKRYAIGNVEVGQEQYTKLKNILLKHIADEIESKKSIDIDIFNVGCKTRP